MKNKTILILLAIILAISTYNVHAKATYTTEEMNDAEVQEVASNLYDQLMSSFPAITNDNDEIEIEYPDNYGGCYINDDGKLVVYQKKNAKDIDSCFLDNDENVIYEEVPYSYNDLLCIKEKIEQYIDKNPENVLSKNINVYGVYDKENKVIVTMKDLSETMVSKFKSEIVSSDAVSFEQGEAPTRTSTLVKSGQKIGKSISSNYYIMGSMGYRAKRNGVVGFVTAGHVAEKGDSIRYNMTGSIIGKSVLSYQNGAIDAAFCEITNSNYIPSNTLDGTNNTLSTTTSNPGVGTVVNKIGAYTGRTSGKVTATSLNITFADGGTVKNVTATNVESAEGDSGGIFYSYISSTNTRLTLGIVIGGKGTTTYYSKASSINSKLGITRY